MPLEGGTYQAGSTKISDSIKSGLNILGDVHFNTTGLTINSSGEYGVVQEGGTLTASGIVSVTDSGYDGLHLTDTTFNADGVVIDKAALSDDEATKNGIYLNASNLTVTGETTVKGVKSTSVNAINMVGKTTIFNGLTIKQAEDATGEAFTQDGGTVNLNGTTDISGQNTYGIHLINGASLNAGDISITGSTVAGFSATEMTDKTTSIGNLDITVAGGGAANAFIQNGGDLTLGGTTNLAIAADGTASSTGTAFNITNATKITLGDVNIGVNDSELQGGSFAQGFVMSSETTTNLLDAGNIKINNITGENALIFSNVAMKDAEGKATNIDSLSIVGSQANGVVLSGSDFHVTGDTTITGSTVSSFSATGMTADNTTNFGKLTIHQVGGEEVAGAFIQDGGTVNLNGITDISGQNTYGIPSYKGYKLKCW